MKNTIKLRLIVCSMVLFTIALGINVFLNSSSVDKLYENTIISQYRAIGESLKVKLTEPLKSGQKIYDIRNIKQILARTAESLKQVGFGKPILYSEFTSTRPRAILENLKNKLINLFFSGLRIVGINDYRQTQPNINQTPHSDHKEVQAFSGDPKFYSGSEYSVSVALPNNIIVSSTNRNFINNRLPEKNLAQLKSGKDKKTM